jgi:glucosamine-6-phosphate deaminase
MIAKIFKDLNSLARAAAEQAGNTIRRAIRDRGRARVILATGTSQFAFLDVLTAMADIDWPRVEAFHLDEYVGIAATHPASFRRILLDRVVQKTGIKNFHPIEGDAADLALAIRDVSTQLESAPIDVAFIGIGENGHVAFNDPPADFETQEPYIVVQLDEACRRQQVGEGWFADVSAVPSRAVSMSPRQIMKSSQIVCVVPDKRKAQAVKASLENEISPMTPASILRRHPDITLYLDHDSASQLKPELRNALQRQSQVVLGDTL